MEYDQLYHAIEDDDIDLVKIELEKLNRDSLRGVVNDRGQSPLMVATLKNNLSLSAIFLNFGFDPNQKDDNELSPFVAAAANGFDKIFKLLCLYEPDKFQFNRFGGTALIPSSEKGYLKTAQLALDYGVPVNHQNRLGWSALLETVILGDGGFLYQDIVRELIEHGGDAQMKDFEGLTSLAHAKAKNQNEIVQIIKLVHEDDYKEIRQFIRDEIFERAIYELYKKEDSLKKFYYLGSTYESLNEFKTAQYYFEKGFEKDAQFAFYLANLLRKQDNPEGALDFFDLGSKEGQSDYFKYHKSNYLRELGHHKKAISVMDELLKEDPKRVDYMFHKANSLRTLGRHEEAYQEMELADKLMPQNELFKEHAQQSASLIERKEENHVSDS